jgi:hypothetical protein
LPAGAKGGAIAPDCDILLLTLWVQDLVSESQFDPA